MHAYVQVCTYAHPRNTQYSHMHTHTNPLRVVNYAPKRVAGKVHSRNLSGIFLGNLSGG